MSIQRPLARHRVMLSRWVVAYYGLIRASEFLPTTYEFAAGAAAPKEIGLGWVSRGSPIYSAGLCSRAASHTPVAPMSASDCCFLLDFSLRPGVTGSTTTLDVSRLQSSFRALFVLILRPASWLALLSRTFTFELAPAGSPRTGVEYDYVGKQSIPTTGLSPASPTALWAAELHVFSPHEGAQNRLYDSIRSLPSDIGFSPSHHKQQHPTHSTIPALRTERPEPTNVGSCRAGACPSPASPVTIPVHPYAP